MKRIMLAKIVWVVIGFSLVNSSTHLYGDDNADGIAILRNSVLSEKLLPRIHIVGSFNSFSAFEAETLQPKTSAEFDGVIDLATHSVQFDFPKYRMPLASNKPEYRDILFSVTYDGHKWASTQSLSKTGQASESGFASTTKISSTRPDLFLQTLDQLCFPIFAPLTYVHLDGKLLPLANVLAGKSSVKSTSVTRSGDCLILKLSAQCTTEEYTFDVTKNFAMTKRIADYNGCDKPGADPNMKIVDETNITEFFRVGLVWVPKKAAFIQRHGEKVTIKKEYSISSVDLVPSDRPIQIVVPNNSYVTDDRFDVGFSTRDSTPSASPSGSQGSSSK